MFARAGAVTVDWMPKVLDAISGVVCTLLASMFYVIDSLTFINVTRSSHKP